jgi:hypothetical protein
VNVVAPGSRPASGANTAVAGSIQRHAPSTGGDKVASVADRAGRLANGTIGSSKVTRSSAAESTTPYNDNVGSSSASWACPGRTIGGLSTGWPTTKGRDTGAGACA